MEKHNLSCELIEAQPRDFDFSQGFGDIWDLALDLTEEELEKDTYAPLMNYAYPLGEGFEVPAKFRDKLNNTTVVRINDRYYLALTGGGMDLSWEICDSYIRLGYYPPVHFCRLPLMAGRGESARDRQIIESCNESLRIAIKWYQQRLENNLRGFSK